MNHRQDPRQRGSPGPIVLLVGAFALVDLLTPAVIQSNDLLTPAVIQGSRSPVVAALFVGSILGQFGLLAVWAVLGPQPLFVRWPLSLLVAALLCCALLLGGAMVDDPGGGAC